MPPNYNLEANCAIARSYSGPAGYQQFCVGSRMPHGNSLMDAVLVTGAGRRVGLHLAQRLHAQNRPIIAHHRTWTEELGELQKQGVLCVAADLATDDGVDHLVTSVRGAV